MSSDRPARRDFARLHLALARRALGIVVEIPDLDGQAAMLDEHDDTVADAVARHPAGAELELEGGGS